MDPAIMASPLITTIVDAVSLVIYFAVAHRCCRCDDAGKAAAPCPERRLFMPAGKTAVKNSESLFCGMLE